MPLNLRSVPYPPAAADPNHVDHIFTFARNNGKWQVNGVSWSAGPEQRILAKPQRGAIEVWDLVNESGGWSHPIHIHLVCSQSHSVIRLLLTKAAKIDFQIVSRTGGARGKVMPYEQVALKDVVWLNTGERVRVIARYAPWDGKRNLLTSQPNDGRR